MVLRDENEHRRIVLGTFWLRGVKLALEALTHLIWPHLLKEVEVEIVMTSLIAKFTSKGTKGWENVWNIWVSFGVAPKIPKIMFGSDEMVGRDDHTHKEIIKKVYLDASARDQTYTSYLSI